MSLPLAQIGVLDLTQAVVTVEQLGASANKDNFLAYSRSDKGSA